MSTLSSTQTLLNTNNTPHADADRNTSPFYTERTNVLNVTHETIDIDKRQINYVMARKVTYDQEKVKILRGALIEDSISVFNDDPQVEKWSEYRKALLARYAPYVLPRLNAGRDDNERLIPQPLLSNVLDNNSNKEDSEPQEED